MTTVRPARLVRFVYAELGGAVIAYHPDPTTDAGVASDVLAAETADLAAGYPPRRWTCPCGASHSRGHYPIGVIGSHRCMRCGYAGTGGVMWDETETDPNDRNSEE